MAVVVVAAVVLQAQLRAHTKTRTGTAVVLQAQLRAHTKTRTGMAVVRAQARPWYAHSYAHTQKCTQARLWYAHRHAHTQKYAGGGSQELLHQLTTYALCPASGEMPSEGSEQ